MTTQMRRFALACAAVGVLGLGFVGGAQAAITVSNQNDSGPGSLRQAILDATPGELISVPAGTYTLTSGALSIQKSVNIVGAGASSTIVRAGGQFGVVQIVGSPSPIAVTLSGMTVRDGDLVGADVSGAGVVSVNADTTLSDMVVTHNTANANGTPGNDGGTSDGAGVLSVTGLLTMNSTVVSENSATAIGGSGGAGGEAEGAGVLSVGPFSIQGSTISNNVADARGGQGPTDPGQDGGIVDGAGFVAVNNALPAASMSSTTISGNVADASAGIGGSTQGNIEGGGALVVTNVPPIAFANVTIAGNVARDNGAAAGGSFADGGGFLGVANAGGSIAFTSSTIAQNSVEGPTPADGGGGNLFAVGPTRLKNTIVAGGSAGANQNCGQSPGSIVSLGFNLDSRDQCGFHLTGDLVNRDPLLQPLANNGGPAPTMAPAGTSPAVDQGTSAGLSGDERGVVRPIDFPTIPNSTAPGADGSDIGAFELQPASSLTVGALKKNKKNGTAQLSVTVPLPDAGTVSLTGGSIVPSSQTVGATGVATFTLVGTKTVKKALKKHGKRTVQFTITYSPVANTPATQTLTTKLVRKHKKKHRKPHHHKHRK